MIKILTEKAVKREFLLELVTQAVEVDLVVPDMYLVLEE